MGSRLFTIQIKNATITKKNHIYYIIFLSRRLIMYYCKDSNINYYKYTLPPSSMFIQNFRQRLIGLISYLFSIVFLALFLIIGYLSITKQESILSWQLKYIFSDDSTFHSKGDYRYMVKSGKVSLGKQEIARIDKILTNCNDTQTINSKVDREENVRTIIVQKGDTLYTLADKAYGNASYYRLIFDANPKILKSKRDLKIGQVLRVPF